MKDSFDGKLSQWAEKAAGQCREIAVSSDPAIRVNKCFYAFQSPPRESPDLLVVGLNPAEEYGYPENRSLQEDVERMKKENPCWGDRENWKIWKETKSYFASDALKDLLENSVYMNEIYFNSASSDSLSAAKGSAHAIKVCRALTQEVVFDIIRPGKIVYLGVSDFYYRIENADYRVLLAGAKNNLLVKKLCRGIPVYGIPHPSGAWGISHEDRAAISRLLEEELLQ
jgi:hypothetical protein